MITDEDWQQLHAQTRCTSSRPSRIADRLVSDWPVEFSFSSKVKHERCRPGRLESKAQGAALPHNGTNHGAKAFRKRGETEEKRRRYDWCAHHVLKALC